MSTPEKPKTPVAIPILFGLSVTIGTLGAFLVVCSISGEPKEAGIAGLILIGIALSLWIARASLMLLWRIAYRIEHGKSLEDATEAWISFCERTNRNPNQ